MVMLAKELKSFLDDRKIEYATISHSPTYTAQEIAAAAHIPGKNLAKTIMVKLDGRLAMAVLPASYRIDFDRLREATGAGRVELASEVEFSGRFPGYETGAMPPFGNLFGLEVFVAESLAEDREIAFNAGTHTDLVKMAYADFERLTNPKVVSFSVKH
jgi:Ala-tRNA(Pro) deacylase